MMQCKNCGIENDADSKFCKQCGQKVEVATAPVADTLPQDDHVRIGELIYTAYKAKEAGRIEEAILACKGALALNDNNASAHSLLGTLYEAKGDLTAAMREYERVLDLNPGGQADRKRLDDLKLGRITPAMMSSEIPAAFNLKPYMPYIAAAVLFFVVLLLGFKMIHKPTGTIEAAGQPTSAPTVYGNIPQGQTPSQQQYGQTSGQMDENTPAGQQATQAQGQAVPNQPTTPSQQPATAQNTRQALTQPSVTSIPRPPHANKPTSEIGFAPTNIEIRPITGPNASNGNETPVITPVITPIEKAATTPAPPQNRDPEEQALKYQSQAKYQEAINSYREALVKTNDKGRVYQSIALCQQRLGQRDQANDSYARAIKAYREELAAGRDAGDIQRKIRACEAGMQANHN